MRFPDAAYGEIQIEDKVLLDVIKTAPLQRLKGIHQYGAYLYILPSLKSSRFEHSLGVCFLLRRLGASLEEQVAGLLHDISHTAFSHVVDFIYGKQETQEHHESLFQQLLMNSEIPKIVQGSGIRPEILLEHDGFPLLERQIPDLCADRLDYFFRDSVIIGVCKPGDISEFLQHLAVREGEILVDDAAVARKMALAFIECGRRFWSNPTQAASFQILADAIKSGLEARVISEDDFLLTDDGLYNKLRDSRNEEITSKLGMLSPGFFAVNNPEDYDFFAKTKARYIDPKVLVEGAVSRLSEIDPGYRKRMEDFIGSVSGGYYVKIFQG